MEETKEREPIFTKDELTQMHQFTRALAAAVNELHKTGTEWHGQGVIILLGVDADTGQAAISVATDGSTPLAQQAAAKAIQAYTDIIVPPDVPGQYL